MSSHPFLSPLLGTSRAALMPRNSKDTEFSGALHTLRSEALLWEERCERWDCMQKDTKQWSNCSSGRCDLTSRKG